MRRLESIRRCDEGGCERVVRGHVSRCPEHRAFPSLRSSRTTGDVAKDAVLEPLATPPPPRGGISADPPAHRAPTPSRTANLGDIAQPDVATLVEDAGQCLTPWQTGAVGRALLLAARRSA